MEQFQFGSEAQPSLAVLVNQRLIKLETMTNYDIEVQSEYK